MKKKNIQMVKPQLQHMANPGCSRNCSDFDSVFFSQIRQFRSSDQQPRKRKWFLTQFGVSATFRGTCQKGCRKEREGSPFVGKVAFTGKLIIMSPYGLNKWHHMTYSHEFRRGTCGSCSQFNCHIVLPF